MANASSSSLRCHAIPRTSRGSLSDEPPRRPTSSFATTINESTYTAESLRASTVGPRGGEEVITEPEVWRAISICNTSDFGCTQKFSIPFLVSDSRSVVQLRSEKAILEATPTWQHWICDGAPGISAICFYTICTPNFIYHNTVPDCIPNTVAKIAGIQGIKMDANNCSSASECGQIYWKYWQDQDRGRGISNNTTLSEDSAYSSIGSAESGKRCINSSTVARSGWAAFAFTPASAEVKPPSPYQYVNVQYLAGRTKINSKNTNVCTGF